MGKSIAWYALSILCLFHTLYAPIGTNDMHQYLLANYYQFGGNYPKATQWYQRVLHKDVPVYAYKGYLMLLYDMKDFANIVQLIPSVTASFEKDPDMQLLFARAYEQVGQRDKADDQTIRLANEFKTHQEIIFQAAQVYVQRKEPENALKVIDVLLNNSPRKANNFIFYFIKAQIYMQLGKHEDALKNIKLCLDMHPHFGKGWLLLALLEEQRGRLDEAIKGYTTFLETGGKGNSTIEQHLLQLVFKQRIMQRNSSTVIMNKSCFEKALYFFEQKEYQKAIEHIDQCLDQKPSDDQSKLLKIQILSAMDQQAQAADLLKKWLQKEPHNQVWLKTLHLLCSTGLMYQKAIAVLEDIIKQHPKELSPLLYLIDLCTRARTFDAALMYYKKAQDLASDADLKTRLAFHSGLIYYEQQKYDDMHKVLEQGYALGQNFPPLLNLLAYYYATSARDLVRAQQLIDKALAHNGTNPHYLDTQALIYYKQQRYDKAEGVLQLVVKKVPHDFDVLKHLGKTYYKLGNKDRAITTIKQALAAAQTDYEKQKCTKLLSCWEGSTK